MQALHWELSVLSRAVAYANLSGAAGNIGISQPQLSRIVARLESHLGVELLDRVSRRRSGWTPVAFKLAEAYSSASAALEKQLQAVTGAAVKKQLRIATLEGLSMLASKLSRALFDRAGIDLIELDVHELNELDELFFKDSVDLLLTSRPPNRRKPKFSKVLGYQSLERISRPGGATRTLVMSAFEHRTRKDSAGREISIAHGKGDRVLVSNSLAIRRRWLEEFGGFGVIPTPVRSRAGEGAARGGQVYLIGSEHLPAALWRSISSIRVES